MALHVTSVGPFGTNIGGEPFDDGTYVGVRSIETGFVENQLTYLRIVYANDQNEVTKVTHGEEPSRTMKYKVRHNERIIRVEGTRVEGKEHHRILGFITSLRFHTDAGNASLLYGEKVGERFTMAAEGKVLAGFHGRLGATFAPAAGAAVV